MTLWRSQYWNVGGIKTRHSFPVGGHQTAACSGCLITVDDRKPRQKPLSSRWLIFILVVCGQLEHCTHSMRITLLLSPTVFLDGPDSLLDCECTGLPPGPRWLPGSPTGRLRSLGSWKGLCGPESGPGPGSSEGFQSVLPRTSGDHTNHTNFTSYSRGTNDKLKSKP